jgi:hypothetical protein
MTRRNGRIREDGKKEGKKGKVKKEQKKNERG